MGFERRRRLVEPLGAPCERIGDGGLNKGVSNMAEMMTVWMMEYLFFLSIKPSRMYCYKVVVRGGLVR